MKQRGHYGMDIRAELEKCRGPLHMACPSCRVDYSTNDVGQCAEYREPEPLSLAFPI